MAVGHAPLPTFAAIDGIRIGTSNAGIKQTERADITIFEICDGATVAGVFTKNAFCAAPVKLCKEFLSSHTPRYLLVNTGNANAGTGAQGFDDAQRCVAALAEKTSVAVEQVLPFSTGVIGELLPTQKIVDALDSALASLQDDAWVQAASSIMTTDTRPKGASHSIEIAGQTIKLSGISKGSGMIKPNMATMLAYVGLDAKISTETLQTMLDEANRLSFNRITVDGDTSTNDSAILVATGKSGVDVDQFSRDELAMLQQALNMIFIELAQLIIRDGEGATKFVAVRVDGGGSEEECTQVAYTVAESPLVKTALFASDANWGRILAAVGRAGVEHLDVEKISVHINDVLIAENGGRAESYQESEGDKALAKEDIHIHIDLRRGEHAATVWTSDLSHEYIRINAEYRT